MPAGRRTSRLTYIDAARGCAIALMALDHGGFFAGVNLTAETFGHRAPDLSSTPHVVLGLLTNLSAPLFWFLSGVSISLLAARDLAQSGSHRAAVRFLLTRAAILVVADGLLMPVLWQPWRHAHFVYEFGLLSSLAVSMLIACALLPVRSSALAVIAGGAALAFPALAIWCDAHLIGSSLALRMWANYDLATHPAVDFPILGWAPLMIGGMAVGRAMTRGGWQRARTWALGAAALLFTWELSLGSGYGGYTRWPLHAGWKLMLIMSKGPPGLDYLAFNLGLGVLLTAALMLGRALLERAPLAWLVVLGRASLFCYFAHFVLIRLIVMLVSLVWQRENAARYAVCMTLALALLVPLAAAYRRLRDANPRSPLRFV